MLLPCSLLSETFILSLSITYPNSNFVSQGWNSLDTVIAAEGLALTLQSTGSLMEAQELFER